LFFQESLCTYCGRNGYTVDICYKKHGYSPGHNLHNKTPQVHQASTQEDNLVDQPEKDGTIGVIRLTS